ncbi:MAG: type IV pilin protein [Burkholderiaceae bacterium]
MGPTPMKRIDGFTLIEMMIVVGILAIIAAIAMPMYTDQVRQGHRAAAQSVLLDLAARQRQFMIERRAYAQSMTELGLTPPATLTSRYTLSVTAVDGAPPTFSVSAAPIGSQASDRCGTLSVDQAGQRLPSGCW